MGFYPHFGDKSNARKLKAFFLTEKKKRLHIQNSVRLNWHEKRAPKIVLRFCFHLKEEGKKRLGYKDRIL